MHVQNVLVEYSEILNAPISTSALLFDERWVLLPAASFLINLSTSKNIPEELQNLPLSEFINKNHLQISTDYLKIFIINDAKDIDSRSAKYVGVFSCKNIKETTDFPLSCGDSTNNYDFNNFLSIFFVFDLKLEQNFKEKHLFKSIENLLKNAQNIKVNRGNAVFIDSCPFGSKELLGSYSQGIICNCIGKNNCYLLTDTPTAPGSEGAPIYAHRKEKDISQAPVGIVISSLNWWRGEHTGLTLGVLLAPLLSQLLPKKWDLQSYLFSDKNSIMRTIDKSIVQVFCGNGWGTGVLIDKENGIFITGSHVVKNGNSESITLKWQNKAFPSYLVYRTQNTPAYDIAILRCAPKYLEQMSALKFATRPAVKGEPVIAAGFPIFKGQDYIFPVVTKGNVSLADSCIFHTTCIILAGSSGGAIVRENGELLGIIVCHTTVTIKNDFVVYPKINMAIPITAVSKPILQYIKTTDTTCLNSLSSTDATVCNKWHLFRAKL